MSENCKPSNKLVNPCIGDCRLNLDEICIGCGRSKDEKLDWIFMSDREKTQTVINAEDRLKKLNSAK